MLCKHGSGPGGNRRGQSPVEYRGNLYIPSVHLSVYPSIHPSRYQVILEKVSFGIFSIILVSKEEKNSSVESNDNMLSLSKFSWNLVIVKIIKIRHFKGHICQKNHDSKIILRRIESYCDKTRPPHILTDIFPL